MLIQRFAAGCRRLCAMAVLLGIVWFGFGDAFATKYAGAFMENGGGARPLAMGGAFTAIADSPAATFWNPAGIATFQNRSILLMHSERFGDLIDRDFATYSQPVQWNLLGGNASGFGLSIIRLGVDDIPYTAHLADQLDTNGDDIVDDEELLGLLDLTDQIRRVSDQELAFFVSYGERLGAWQVGANLKVVHQSVGDNGSWGIGADVAFLRPRFWKQMHFGLKLQDITTTYLSWDTGRSELITPAVIPGLAYDFLLTDWNMRVTAASDVETRFDNRRDADQYWGGSVSANVHAGVEVGFVEKVFLRGGFDSGWDAAHLTAGAGFRIRPLTVDYAYAGDTLDIDEVTHRISLTVSW
jgi:hypothetical protein